MLQETIKKVSSEDHRQKRRVLGQTVHGTGLMLKVCALLFDDG